VAWLSFLKGSADAPRIAGEGHYLRPAVMEDHAGWARLRAQSRAFLTPWEPTWQDDELTKTAFRRRLRRHAQEADRDQGRHFLIFDTQGDRLVGGLSLGEIRRGVSQTATLGYWLGAPYAGQGRMTRAVRAASAWGFAQLGLHRIEAACVTENTASARLLEKNGFRHEGRARAYLKINGAWKDHELYALLAGDAAAG
jgi:[ribosomal protein S5]-alanine N-acetyltransferase